MAKKEEEFLKEIQEAFALEAEERMNNLISSLLKLEKAESETLKASIIEEIYRDAHSLKGASRAVNLQDIESIFQIFEDVLALAKEKKIELTLVFFDAMHKVTDLTNQLLTTPQDKSPSHMNEIMDILKSMKSGNIFNHAAKKINKEEEKTFTESESIESKPDVTAKEKGSGKKEEKSSDNKFSQKNTEDLPDTKNIFAQRDKSEETIEKSNIQDLSGQELIIPLKDMEYDDENAGDELPERKKASHRSQDKSSQQNMLKISSSKLNSLLGKTEEMISLKLASGQITSFIREITGIFDNSLKEWNKLQPDIKELRRHNESEKAGSKAMPLLSKFLDYFQANSIQMKLLKGKLRELASLSENDHHFISTSVDDLLSNMRDVLMLPSSHLIDFFPKLVRDLSRDQGKEVNFVYKGGEIEIDRRILEDMKDPLIHLLRNNIDHGIEKPEERQKKKKARTGNVSMIVSQVDGSKIEILVTDDGAGINIEKVKSSAIKQGLISKKDADDLNDEESVSLIFSSGLSTNPIITNISGRGIGLAILKEKVEKLGGRIIVKTEPGKGTTFRILLPVTLANFRGILIKAAGQLFIIPVTNVERVMRTRKDEIKTIENRDTILVNEHPLALVRLDDVLMLPKPAKQAEEKEYFLVLILGSSEKRIAFYIDEIISDQEVLVKPLGKQLSRIKNISGASILGSGKVVPVLNVPDLIKSALKAKGSGITGVQSASGEIDAKQRKILVVEDSITSRMLIKNILESAGYEVITAFDGVDGWTKLKTEEIDAVCSDVEMPRMNGFDLTSKIRSDPAYTELPVILVTGLASQEDRERGIDVGANAYIVKSSFDQSNLLEVIQRLI